MLLFIYSLALFWPIIGSTPVNLPRKALEIPEPLLHEFTLFSQFAAAANCGVNHRDDSAGKRVYCDEGKCPDLEEADTVIIDGFQGLMPGDTTGYIAVDHTHELIVVSFRGTVSDENAKTDLDIKLVPVFDICEQCLGHRGFWTATSSASTHVTPLVETAAAEHQGYRIVITGHSLGGAIATFEAAILRNKGMHVDLISFGAPSVGDRKLASFITNEDAGMNYRITHTNDPVPKILYLLSKKAPAQLQYSQISPEYWITSGDGEPVTTSDIQVIEGVDNTDGNLGTKGSKLSAHGWYLGNMTVCAEV